MRTAIAAALALCALPAAADVRAVATSQYGSLELHDDAGLCVGKALRAQFVYNDGQRVAGCWTMDGDEVSLVFLDGDAIRVPRQAFRSPTAS